LICQVDSLQDKYLVLREASRQFICCQVYLDQALRQVTSCTVFSVFLLLALLSVIQGFKMQMHPPIFLSKRLELFRLDSAFLFRVLLIFSLTLNAPEAWICHQ
jgi:hypothetical protein